ncbi:uncharacterized protein LOC752915 [Strongylocentrotus purpuratus]|uniref:Protein phosphatase 1 regulatory subunit 35 C-terminal domain-containing protein n=1 Tax=Strongylocentrotus purpuratus TaxID=7668 RepID=A0A7M7NY96_STRPU|nr:uncharacterized protein LOC752915 [Strongylocentrotus purpuratus]|eukprot:XP_001180540.1 PREDICTED: uncharacterized protein LOC752915 [Strongylocentrotus purpuratus]
MASDSEDIDPHPLPGGAVPKPMQRTSSPDFNNFLDPLLALTPDKPQKIAQVVASQRQRRGGTEKQKGSNKENRGSVTEELNKDSESHSKEGTTSPGLISHPSVLFQQERTNRDQILQKNLKIIKHGVPETDSKKEARNKDEIAAARVNKLTKLSSTSAPKDAVLQRKSTTVRSCVQNKQKHTGATSKKHVRIVDPKTPLSTPELHSTAALGHQLKQLEIETFNAEEVLVKTLQDSEAARVAFSERVAEAANVNKHEKKYLGLVSVGVPVESTLQRALTQRHSRVKRRTQRPSKASEVPPPDILEMFSPAMIVESAKTDVSGLIPPKVKAAPVDPDMTFDLYRHMQCWDLGH